MVPKIYEYVSPEGRNNARSNRRTKASASSQLGSNNQPQIERQKPPNLWSAVARSLYEGVGINHRADSADEDLASLDRIEDLIRKLRELEENERMVKDRVAEDKTNPSGDNNDKKKKRKLSISKLNPFKFKPKKGPKKNDANDSTRSSFSEGTNVKNENLYSSFNGFSRNKRAESTSGERKGDHEIVKGIFRRGNIIRNSDFISLGGVGLDNDDDNSDEDNAKRGFFRKKRKSKTKEFFYNCDDDEGIEFTDFSPKQVGEAKTNSIDSLKRAHLLPSQNSLRSNNSADWLGEEREIRRSCSRLFESEVDSECNGDDAVSARELIVDSGEDDYDFYEEEDPEILRTADISGGRRPSHDSFFTSIPVGQLEQQGDGDEGRESDEAEEEEGGYSPDDVQRQTRDAGPSILDASNSYFAPLPTIDNYNGAIDELPRGSSETARDVIVRELASAANDDNSARARTRTTSAASSESHFVQAMLKMYPASAAAFIRAMTICGFGSLIFHLHTMIWWATSSSGRNVFHCFLLEGGYVRSCVEGSLEGVKLADFVLGPQPLSPEAHVRWLWLALQIMVALMKLPFRINTMQKLQPLYRNTGLNVSEARERLKSIITGRGFKIHAFLGRINQILGLVGLFFYFGENFIVKKLVETGFLPDVVPPPPPSASLVSTQALMDVNCANLLVAVLRSVLAIAVLKTHADRERRRRARRAVAERRRGLLEAEMDALKKETWWGRDNSTEDLNGTNSVDSTSSSSARIRPSRPLCSICLERFSTGDEIWILPCDERHIFHGDCIKSWLRKNNSCPLCQKNVVQEKMDEDVDDDVDVSFSA